MTEEVKEAEETHRKSAKIKWAKLASKAVNRGRDYELNEKGERRNFFDTLLASDSDEHVVFKPGQYSEGRLAQLVSSLVKEQRSAAGFKSKLKERQMKMEEHVKTTKEVVREQTVTSLPIINETPKVSTDKQLTVIDEQTEQNPPTAIDEPPTVINEPLPLINKPNDDPLVTVIAPPEEFASSTAVDHDDELEVS